VLVWGFSMVTISALGEHESKENSKTKNRLKNKLLVFTFIDIVKVSDNKNAIYLSNIA
jgi:hypothetical protein